jgi:hypothetical protein
VIFSDARPYAHKMVAHLAQEMAHALYEEAAKDNEWFREHPDPRPFVAIWAPRVLDEARAQLTDMLTRHDLPDDQKELIFDALKADREIPRGGVAVEH